MSSTDPPTAVGDAPTLTARRLDGLGDRVFGTLPDRIADETGDPVIVIKRDF